MAEDQSVVQAEFRELSPEAFAPLEVSHNRRLTPQNESIPIPAYLADWHPNMAALSEDTPKDYRRVATNKDGQIMYRYAPVSWFTKVANKVWGSPFGPQWGLETIREIEGDRAPNGNFEYTCILQFVAPGLFRPIVGVGSSTYYASNAQESMAKTRNAAYTSAFKSCLRQLGVARDIEEDDPEVARTVEGRLQTIGQTFQRLVGGDKGDEARAIVRRIEPTALLDSGDLLVGSIAFENLERIQRELLALVIAGAAAKKGQA